MNYKSIVKYILDNFVFTTLNTEFKYPYEETEFGNEIPNNVISGESQRFYDFFDHTFFKVGNDYFHNKEGKKVKKMPDFLCQFSAHKLECVNLFL